MPRKRTVLSFIGSKGGVKASRSNAALWRSFLACQRRGIRLGGLAIAVSFSPWLDAQQLYSGSFEQHDLVVEYAGCNAQPNPPEVTSSHATYSQPFEVDASTCSWATQGGSSTIKGLMNMKFPSVTPTAVGTPSVYGSGYFNIQFQTPLELDTDTSGFFLLNNVVRWKWQGYSFINAGARLAGAGDSQYC